jgi:hypothetical protein
MGERERKKKEGRDAKKKVGREKSRWMVGRSESERKECEDEWGESGKDDSGERA